MTSPTTPTKPHGAREFWIRPPHEKLPFGACANEQVLGGIHVIEHRALTEAQDEIARWKNEYQELLNRLGLNSRACEDMGKERDALKAELINARQAMQDAHKSLKWSEAYDGRILSERDQLRALAEQMAKVLVKFCPPLGTYAVGGHKEKGYKALQAWEDFNDKVSK